MEQREGSFNVSPATRIVIRSASEDLRTIGSFLADMINTPTGYAIKVVAGLPRRAGDIVLSLDGKSASEEDEAYRLDVSKSLTHVTAGTARGLFYGVQTLRQLLPVQIENRQGVKEKIRWTIPCVSIVDRPRYPYRGLHLDACRHFFPKEFVKKYIDLLAFHKMNKFHWQLSDDQGWRIEIKRYPRLTEVGAWRTEDDGSVYGGYYTQDDVREIVEYARSRFVDIIPEIEMPGHSSAALAAYPQLSCTGGPFKVGTQWGVYDDLYCAGNDSTFAFLQDILTELVGLFPGKYIHIGGDEAPKIRWRTCAKCRARMKAESLKDEAELQSYFIKRIEKFLISKDRRLIGWDEILEGGIAQEATVMSWQGKDGGIAAARQGHDAIMTPGTHCYFDHYQGRPAIEPKAFGGYTPLSKVYAYEPTPPELTREEAEHNLGAQGNLWSEYIKSDDQLEYMAVPRMCALAEVLWSPKGGRTWDDFSKRMSVHFQRLDLLGINYARSLFNVDATAAVDTTHGQLVVTLSTGENDRQIRYTLDGTDPRSHSPVYERALLISTTTTLKAGTFDGEKLLGKICSYDLPVDLATGRAVRLAFPYSDQYTGGGPAGLTNGVRGSLTYDDGNWQGFEGNDLEAIIDLQNVKSIRRISAGFLQDVARAIFFPAHVEYAVSNDGVTFTTLSVVQNNSPLNSSGSETKIIAHDTGLVQARYVKVLAKNIGVCPPGFLVSGGKAMIFADEIVVE